MLFIKEIKKREGIEKKENSVFADAIVDFVKNNTKEIELVADFEDKLKQFKSSLFNDYLISEIAEEIQIRKQAKDPYDFVEESSNICESLSLTNAIQMYMEIDNIQEISFIIIDEITRTNSAVYDIIIKNEKVLNNFLKKYEIKLVS